MAAARTTVNSVSLVAETWRAREVIYVKTSEIITLILLLALLVGAISLKVLAILDLLISVLSKLA